MFGRKSRAEKAKDSAKRRAEDSTFVPAESLAAFYASARPVLERLLYDDELRDNIRTFIDSSRKISEELSGDSPSKMLDRLWDDKKIRQQVEAATAAAQQGTRRVRGEKVKSGGGGGRSGTLLLFLAAVVGFVFLSPWTGAEARRLAGEALGSLRSG